MSARAPGDDVVHVEAGEPAAVAGRDLDDAQQVLVADEARGARVLPGDAEQIAGAVGAPQVADAVGAEREPHARAVELVKGQLRQPQRRDRRHGDVERRHRLQLIAAAPLVDLRRSRSRARC